MTPQSKHRSPPTHTSGYAGNLDGTGIILEPVPEGPCPQCDAPINFGSAIPLSKATCKACGAVFLTPGRVDSFLLLDRIGTGEMGEIYRARDIMLNRDVAIKVVRAARADDETLRERLRREAQAAARVNHPHVAQVFALGFSNGYPYLVMELVGGKDMLEHLTRDQRIDERTALQITLDIANGLKALHEKGLTHGDLKPGNIVLNPQGKAKLVDFGLSGMARKDSTGSIVGTPYYIAPESLHGVPDNCQTDIYSLGATLYHLLSGKAPFGGSTPDEIVRARLTKQPDPIGRYVPELSSDTKQILTRMMSREPTQRYPDCDILMSDLAGALKRLNRADRADKASIASDRPRIAIEPPKKPPALRTKTQSKAVRPPETPSGNAQTRPASRQPSGRPSGRRPRRAHRILVYGFLAVITLSVFTGIHHGLRTPTEPDHHENTPAHGPVSRNDATVPPTRLPASASDDGDIRIARFDFPLFLEPQWVSGSLGGRSGGSTAWSPDRALILQVSGSHQDVYRYIHTGTTGDFEFSVLLTAMDQLTVAGLMIRESSDDSGPYLFFNRQENGRLLFEVQDRNQAPRIVFMSDEPIRLPRRLRMVRVGNRFQAAIFDNGVWEPIIEHTLAIREQTRVGLAISCHVPGLLGTAEFEDVFIRITADPGYRNPDARD